MTEISVFVGNNCKDTCAFFELGVLEETFACYVRFGVHGACSLFFDVNIDLFRIDEHLGIMLWLNIWLDVDFAFPLSYFLNHLDHFFVHIWDLLIKYFLRQRDILLIHPMQNLYLCQTLLQLDVYRFIMFKRLQKNVFGERYFPRVVKRQNFSIYLWPFLLFEQKFMNPILVVVVEARVIFDWDLFCNLCEILWK